MPEGFPILDTYMNVPPADKKAAYGMLEPLLRDKGSDDMVFPAEFLFTDHPDDRGGPDWDPIRYVLDAMDRNGVAEAFLHADPLRPGFDEGTGKALAQHPDRFHLMTVVNPNEGMEAVRKLRRHVTEFGAVATMVFPAGTHPPVGIADPLMYPLYAECVLLDVPICVCAGVPGPRLPLATQTVEQIDVVMYDFPDLVFVTRHGCEPWEDLMVKLLLKWPNLYYSTSAFAPKHYPTAIVDYANTRGADKVIYAGYFPDGLSLDRIMGDMPHVAFRDHVWAPFLRQNAERVFLKR